MKIVITGHTSGIGKWFYDYYVKQGYDVAGYSRTNGFDITHKHIQDYIVNACEDADIFINNAYSGFAQADLVFAFCNRYKTTTKTIVNIGSSITQRLDRYTPETRYRATKLALEESCREAWTDVDNRVSDLKVMLVNPCKTQTNRTLQNPWNSSPVAVEDLCNLIIYCLNTSGYIVRELGLGLAYN